MFKTKAGKIEQALKAAGVSNVALNSEKPRKGSFVITIDGKVALELLDLTRPFQKLKSLDLDEVVADILAKVK